MRLENKTAMITGAARGIGLATANRFAAEGARVALCDIDEEAGWVAEAAVSRESSESFFVRLDVTDRTGVDAVARNIRSEFGRIDILINNAGVTADARLGKMTELEWDSVIDTNLKGVFNCTEVVARIMMDQGHGCIVSAASVVAHYGNFGQTNYVAAKAGVIGMTRVWARELGPKGIRVNAVAPGFIETEMTRAVPADILGRFVDNTPLSRTGTPEEVANAYLFLASDESSFINGAILNVDGGLVF